MNKLDQLILKFAESAESILLIGGRIASVISIKECIHLTDATLDRLSQLGQFDLVIINGQLQNLSLKDGEKLIAQCRDLHARQMLVINTSDSGWQATEFASLGLRQFTDPDLQDEHYQVWYFALENYKRVPDWLNSRYWANPELFGKYRW